MVESTTPTIFPIEEVPKLSKNAQKRLAKQAKWEQKQLEAKERKKEKKAKKNVTSFSHTRRFNHLREEQDDSKCLTKKQKQQLFKQLAKKGPIMVIDCDFEPLMVDKELKSLSQQLSYCCNINKQQTNPLNLLYAGVGPKLMQSLQKNNCQNWHVQITEKPYLEATIETDKGQQAIDQKRFVYLTADSPNIITELNPDDIYIIGGIVDRNRYINLTLNKANKDGIRHGKLPIGDYVKLQTSAVLAVNHVLEIVATYYVCKDWR